MDDSKKSKLNELEHVWSVVSHDLASLLLVTDGKMGLGLTFCKFAMEKMQGDIKFNVNSDGSSNDKKNTP